MAAKSVAVSKDTLCNRYQNSKIEQEEIKFQAGIYKEKEQKFKTQKNQSGVVSHEFLSPCILINIYIDKHDLLWFKIQLVNICFIFMDYTLSVSNTFPESFCSHQICTNKLISVPFYKTVKN